MSERTCEYVENMIYKCTSEACDIRLNNRNDRRNYVFGYEQESDNIKNIMYKCASEPIDIHPLPSIKQLEAPPLILN